MDYTKLRKKFPAKKIRPAARTRKAAKKAIAAEYERKLAEIGGAAETKRGFPYYIAVVMGLLLACGLAGSAIYDKGGLDLSKRKGRIAAASVRNLAIAAGRYRYHTGVYPTTGEGLEQLVSKKVKKEGWNGPYIAGGLKPDPWGNAYVYVSNGDREMPTLYSSGPDGEAGTTDDVMAQAADFEEPFRDTSWTEGWVRYELRGILPAVDERHRRELREAVAKELEKNASGRPPPRESGMGGPPSGPDI